MFELDSNVLNHVAIIRKFKVKAQLFGFEFLSK